MVYWILKGGIPNTRSIIGCEVEEKFMNQHYMFVSIVHLFIIFLLCIKTFNVGVMCWCNNASSGQGRSMFWCGGKKFKLDYVVFTNLCVKCISRETKYVDDKCQEKVDCLVEVDSVFGEEKSKRCLIHREV